MWGKVDFSHVVLILAASLGVGELLLVVSLYIREYIGLRIVKRDGVPRQHRGTLTTDNRYSEHGRKRGASPAVLVALRLVKGPPSRIG
jgi:hypothetical protein